MDCLTQRPDPYPQNQVKLKNAPVLLVMKVGFHGNEPLAAIVARKRAEEETLGFSLWGYGGTLCHPLTQVRPLLANVGETQSVHVAFIETSSKPQLPLTIASRWSVDGISWFSLPPGAHVTASKFALILSNLEVSDFILDLAAYHVAVGQHKGVPLSRYLRGRVDKACAVRANLASEDASPTCVRVKLSATLRRPFAVFLR